MRGAHLHLDCTSGLAGDMFLGACLDLGMPLAVMVEAVAALGLAGVTVEARRSQRGGFAGTRFRVLVDGQPVEGPDPEEVEAGQPHEPVLGDAHEHAHDRDEGDLHEHRSADAHDHLHDDSQHHGHGESPEPAADYSHDDAHGHTHGRDLRAIRHLIGASALAPAVRDRALALFSRLGEAEARVHGVAIERVHFHEVGAVDSIVDLVGAAAAVEHLAPTRITCGPVNVGGGVTRGAHGRMPVPPPAVAELMRGLPIYGGAGGELLTPTGAVLLAELVDEFRDLPRLVLTGIGYGLGRQEVAGQANAVRLLMGDPATAAPTEELVVIESEIDHLPGEGFGYLLERLLESGALDAYFTAVQMKKNRPGTLVTVLARHEQLATLAALLLAETGSLGCRFHAAGRFEAERETRTVGTRFGAVRVKVSRFAGAALAVAPEYEDCRALARQHGVPWREVWRAALVASDAREASR